MYIDLLVAGHVDHAAVIQCGMKHSKRLVPGHIDFVKDAEAPLLCTEPHRPRTEHHPVPVEGIRADQPGGIHADVKGNIPRRPVKAGRKIVGQHIFTSRFGTAQQKVLSRKKGGQCLFPDFFPIISVIRKRNSALLHLTGCRIRSPEFRYAVQQIAADPLFF